MDTDSSVEDERVTAQRLCKELVQHTTLETFAVSCASVWDSWILLLSQTIIPPKSSSRDSHFALAFQAVERTVSTTDGVLQWLAYARLIRLFDTLTGTIGKERRGLMCQRKRGVGDDSIAMNIYQDALEGKLQRRTIVERRRIGKRWVLLSKPSPLLLLAYSTRAETIVNAFGRIKNPFLELVGDQASQSSSPQFIRLCIRLAQGAEEAASSGFCNLQQLWDTICREENLKGVQ